MTFSDKDLHAQEQQLQMLGEELSRLNTQFDAQIKGLGISENDLLATLDSEMSPELQKMMSEAQDKSKREGAARAAQGAPTPSTGAKAPEQGDAELFDSNGNAISFVLIAFIETEKNAQSGIRDQAGANAPRMQAKHRGYHHDDTC